MASVRLKHDASLLLDTGSPGTGIPYVKPTASEIESPGRELEGHEATMYRAIVARANYLSQDRSDIQYAVKELSRSMSSPTVSDWNALKRLGRYLLNKER